tara:strand:+ start:881 stop:1075 length:195 start_codon:yes stop_codon:yes gene_type:complete
LSYRSAITVYIYRYQSRIARVNSTAMIGGFMCGRFTQYRTAIEYLEALRYDKPIESGIDPECWR